MLERLKWPGLALLLGGLGVLVRRWQMRSAFEETLGLHEPGSPASWAMLAFVILASAVFLLMAHNAPCRMKVDGWMSRWDFAFAASRDSLYLTLMVLAGLMTLAAAPFLFQEAMRFRILQAASSGEGDNGLLQVVLALCTIPSCVGLVSSARNAFRMKGRSKENGALLLPVLFGCVWLLEAYRANAADPVLWHYVPLLLAISLGMLFFLDCAGLSFGMGHARRMLWLAAMTVVVSVTALASMHGTATSLLLGGQSLAALAALWVVPENLRSPPATDRFGLRARLRQGLPLDDPDNEIEEAPEEDETGSEPLEIQEEDTHV